jgi:hypothetical protein
MNVSPARSSGFCRVLIAMFVAVAIAPVAVQAQAVEPVSGKLSVDQMTDRAAAIVVGTVISRHAEWEFYGASKLIITKVTIAVEQSVKRGVPRTLVIEVMGGTIGDQTLTVSDVPEFKVGDRDVLFLNLHPHAVSPLIGSNQGLFRVINESATGVPRILTGGYAPIPRDAASIAATGALPTLSGAWSLDEFVGQIRDRVRAQGRR